MTGCIELTSNRAGYILISSSMVCTLNIEDSLIAVMDGYVVTVDDGVAAGDLKLR